ncbi:hypothetical protein [Bradyrhizobium archetypum]|uniref:hypothetical protein n=1 Tax=Bradyrhizobium archetypum TaxID=2721160 RepID=UPI001AEE3E63|nr:hypothetical protein [Bradyrhizobium archetypum]
MLLAHQENAHEHTGSAETLRPSLRNGFTAYFVLSPENGFIASVAPEQLSLLKGLNASTAAPEPHDFAVRLPRATSLAPSASIASHRAFVTFASAPHLRSDGRSYATDLGANESGIFLICGLDTISENQK